MDAGRVDDKGREHAVPRQRPRVLVAATLLRPRGAHIVELPGNELHEEGDRVGSGRGRGSVCILPVLVIPSGLRQLLLRIRQRLPLVQVHDARASDTFGLGERARARLAILHLRAGLSELTSLLLCAATGSAPSGSIVASALHTPTVIVRDAQTHHTPGATPRRETAVQTAVAANTILHRLSMNLQTSHLTTQQPSRSCLNSPPTRTRSTARPRLSGRFLPT